MCEADKILKAKQHIIKCGKTELRSGTDNSQAKNVESKTVKMTAYSMYLRDLKG